MRTRTREADITPAVLNIPTKIQDDIEEKGFHLYKWISPEEVKLSIERDFLKTLKYVGAPLGIIAIILGLLTFIGFFVTVFIGVFFMFLYLLVISLRRSFLLSKSAFVVLTDSSISLGGKIVKLSEISEIQKDMDHIGHQFEENLFEDSQLGVSKSSLTKAVMDQLFGGYKFIFSTTDSRFGVRNDKDSTQFLLALLALYTLYIGVMSVVYFIGVLFLWVFGNVMTQLNTWFLLKRGHSVLKINDLFGKIDRNSQDIKSEKIELEALLTEAYNNNWQDGLLGKINSRIDDINTSAKSVIDEVVELRSTIEASRYKDMFSFSIYHGWVKKQVRDPLEAILKLLKKHRNIIQDTIEEIEEQITQTPKTEHKSALALQIKRLNMQLADIETFIPILETSVEKLHS